LLHLDGKIIAVLLRVFLLDADPRPAQILVKRERQQGEKQDTDNQEGTP
jgi:hypothetical protein